MAGCCTPLYMGPLIIRGGLGRCAGQEPGPSISKGDIPLAGAAVEGDAMVFMLSNCGQKGNYALSCVKYSENYNGK